MSKISDTSEIDDFDERNPIAEDEKLLKSVTVNHLGTGKDNKNDELDEDRDDDNRSFRSFTTRKVEFDETDTHQNGNGNGTITGRVDTGFSLSYGHLVSVKVSI